jgi:hypothetical protein
MKYERHWVAVYMGSDTTPTYRGHFLPGDGTTTFLVRGKPGDNSIPTPERSGLKVADIQEVIRLEDPAWVADSNAGRVVLKATTFLSDLSDREG